MQRLREECREQKPKRDQTGKGSCEVLRLGETHSPKGSMSIVSSAKNFREGGGKNRKGRVKINRRGVLL